jgi:hypothetical protein
MERSVCNVNLFTHRHLFSTCKAKCWAFNHERDTISAMGEVIASKECGICKQISSNVLYEMLK